MSNSYTNKEWEDAYNGATKILFEFMDVDEVGFVNATSIVNLLIRYDNGERTDELYEELLRVG